MAALMEGASVDDQDTVRGWTALHWAIFTQQQHIVEYLCTTAGADTAALDNEGKAPIHVAW